MTRDPEKQKKKTFNGLTAREWTMLSRNVWRDLGSPRKKEFVFHGATFPPKLCDRVIKMYSKRGDLVFDPFLGTGITLQVAKKLERRGVGIELNKEFVKIAKKLTSQSSLKEEYDQKIINDDTRNMKEHIEKDSVQLILTSPPYANFIRKSVEDRKKTHKKSLISLNNKSKVKPYSDDERDFGNYPYDYFLEEIKKILAKCFYVTKPGGYNVWVVKDYRDTKNKIPYIDFHSDIANLGIKVGFNYHDLIILDQNEQRSLVLLGYPSVFYTNQNCSFLVVFRKPKNDNL